MKTSPIPALASVIAVLLLLVAQPAFAQPVPDSQLSGQISGAETPVEQKKQIKPEDYYPYPVPGSGYVTDDANLLSNEQEEEIEKWLWQTESMTGVEMAVVTIPSINDYPGTANGSIEEFAKALFDKYGIGNRPGNNGILFLVAVSDRKSRIELGAGYGHDKDQHASRIMDNDILPYFKRGDFPGGIRSGVIAIADEFANVSIGPRYGLIAIAVAIPVLIIIAISLFRNGKKGWGWIAIALIVVLLVKLISSIVYIMRHMPQGDSSGWDAGGAGGGFGGGFSGGGGATGSW